jgi:hypothetical protein
MKTYVIAVYLLWTLMQIHYFFVESVPEFLEERLDDMKNFVKRHEKLFLGLLVLASFSSWVLLYTVFLLAIFFIAMGIVLSTIFKRKEVEVIGTVIEIEPCNPVLYAVMSDISISHVAASAHSARVKWWIVRVSIENGKEEIRVDVNRIDGIIDGGPFHAVCKKYKLQKNNFELEKMLS